MKKNWVFLAGLLFLVAIQVCVVAEAWRAGRAPRAAAASGAVPR